ncbi:hypothetical protein QZH41_018597 [Actinostola sp. cb2023]|nr:hypothetical protein QZH41_018597 [Actinostola sp. cb2023]
MSASKSPKLDNSTRKRKRRSSFSENSENGCVLKKMRQLAPSEPAVYFDSDETQRQTEDFEPISLEDAENGKAEHTYFHFPATRPIRVYADGIFDLFHFGHARALMQAKKCFPTAVYLMVGVCDDELTHTNKGFTVMTEEERYQSLLHSRYVDEVIRGCMIMNQLIMTRSDDVDDDDGVQMMIVMIDFIAHDAIPYKSAGAEDVYKEIKEMGKFVATQRTEGISTSDIIARVVKDYDVYIRRNLARGYTAKELNVGFMKVRNYTVCKMIHEKEVLVRNKVDEIKGKINNKSQEFLEKWEEKSRELIGRFIDIFGRDGHLDRLFEKGRDKIWGAREKIRGAGRRIQRALSPNPYDDPDYYDAPSPSVSPDSSPKRPRLSLEPEISSDEED